MLVSSPVAAFTRSPISGYCSQFGSSLNLTSAATTSSPPIRSARISRALCWSFQGSLPLTALSAHTCGGSERSCNNVMSSGSVNWWSTGGSFGFHSAVGGGNGAARNGNGEAARRRSRSGGESSRRRRHGVSSSSDARRRFRTCAGGGEAGAAGRNLRPCTRAAATAASRAVAGSVAALRGTMSLAPSVRRKEGCSPEAAARRLGHESGSSSSLSSAPATSTAEGPHVKPAERRRITCPAGPFATILGAARRRSAAGGGAVAGCRGALLYADEAGLAVARSASRWSSP
mmetsp:Transcript_67822/g.196402  ORF Transcript_67822/g.196402 Transcript_67822/m.196402 type:complete len:288 (+) Transcript_67822:374-1237(+)